MNLDFDQLQKVLADSRALTDAAEAHGTLTGALCAALDFSLEDWCAELYADGRTDEDALAALQEVFSATRAALVSDQMDFRPLLPDDETSIEARAEALGHWCQGFLYGLGSRPLPGPEQMSREAGEVVRDLTAMTQVTADADAGEESNEEAWLELTEFVRVAAQLLFDEFERWRGAQSVGPADDGALH
jgi:yecA family protein